MADEKNDQVEENEENIQEVVVEVNADPEKVVETSESVDSAEDQDWKNQTMALKDELSTLKDQYLRKQADFDNYRKRMQKEKQDSILYGNSRLLEDLIEVIDNFERAIKSAKESRDFDNFHQGIVMIEQQFVGMLGEKYGLKRIDSLGQAFDPQKHEALAMDPDSGEQPVVVEEYQKGFFLHERVLRAAKVRVGAEEPSPETEGADEANGTDESPQTEEN